MTQTQTLSDNHAKDLEDGEKIIFKGTVYTVDFVTDHRADGFVRIFTEEGEFPIIVRADRILN